MSSSSRSSIPAGVPFLVVLVALCWEIPTASSFVPSLPPSLKWQSMTTTTTTTAATTTGRRSLDRSSGRNSRVCLSNALNDDNEDDDDEDDDEYIDTDSLGDWRNFRRTLSIVTDEDTQQDETSSTRKKSTVKEASSSSSVTNKNKNENEELLKSQNKELHQEYKTGVWAHETSTVSLILRVCGGNLRTTFTSMPWDPHRM